MEPTAPLRPPGRGVTRPVWIAVAIVFLAALVVVTYATAEHELQWLVVIPQVVFTGLLIGTVVSVAVYFFSPGVRRLIWWIPALSGVIFLVLIVGECFVGPIRAAYQAYGRSLARVERQKELHEVDLGRGHLLFYRSLEDSVFSLNFEFAGGRTITKGQIRELARAHLATHGYEPGSGISVHVREKIFGKLPDRFAAVAPARMFVQIDYGASSREYKQAPMPALMYLVFPRGDPDFVMTGYVLR